MNEPSSVYPPSTEAIREWFRRAHGREATDLEVGELERALAKRQDQTAPGESPDDKKEITL